MKINGKRHHPWDFICGLCHGIIMSIRFNNWLWVKACIYIYDRRTE